MKNSLWLAVLPMVLFSAACRKEKTSPKKKREPVTTEMANGIPSRTDSIHGYLYAGFRFSDLFGNPSASITAIAMFSDPARALASNYNPYTDQFTFTFGTPIPNVSVNMLKFNGTMMQWQNSGIPHYRLGQGLNKFDQSAHWEAEGNGSFTSFSGKPPKGFPQVDFTVTANISSTSVYSLNLNDHLSRYDSAIVILGTLNSIGGPSFTRRATPERPTVLFVPEEISAVQASFSTFLTVIAFNYSHRTVNNKRYLFVLSSKVEQHLTIGP